MDITYLCPGLSIGQEESENELDIETSNVGVDKILRKLHVGPSCTHESAFVPMFEIQPVRPLCVSLQPQQRAPEALTMAFAAFAFLLERASKHSTPGSYSPGEFVSRLYSRKCHVSRTLSLHRACQAYRRLLRYGRCSCLHFQPTRFSTRLWTLLFLGSSPTIWRSMFLAEPLKNQQ